MFNWQEYLSLADELAKRPDEASKRSAVSRAYYAIFHSARVWLENKGTRVPRDGTGHQFVWEEFERIGSAARSRNHTHVGQTGDRLRRERALADYEANVPNFANHVTPVLTSARQIIAYLKSL